MKEKYMGQSLTIQKLADRSGDRLENGDWPLAGVAIIGDPPEEINISQDYAVKANREGWASLNGMKVVYRPKGDDVEREPHTFVHADSFTIHTQDGDVTYRVTHQPDKYVADGDDDTKMTDEHFDAGNTRVDHFYSMKLEG